jgi:hypothetical protein
MVIDNTAVSIVVAQGGINTEKMVKNDDIWGIIVQQSKYNG